MAIALGKVREGKEDSSAISYNNQNKEDQRRSQFDLSHEHDEPAIARSTDAESPNTGSASPEPAVTDPPLPSPLSPHPLLPSPSSPDRPLPSLLS
ncbi:hypothetical protein E2562_037770 [Oryza meyeriana var. granulata]|uniref:Uncharacterized protein n=1 Tax=Oryza meyeriana var. granulata TaxID=110450 RepID=A0A6G1C341_9ORYZ|nr:hypothetical protein E2562_037770 [Oryza meyeriana var. granulata]